MKQQDPVRRALEGVPGLSERFLDLTSRQVARERRQKPSSGDSFRGWQPIRVPLWHLYPALWKAWGIYGDGTWSGPWADQFPEEEQLRLWEYVDPEIDEHKLAAAGYPVGIIQLVKYPYRAALALRGRPDPADTDSYMRKMMAWSRDAELRRAIGRVPAADSEAAEAPGGFEQEALLQGLRGRDGEMVRMWREGMDAPRIASELKIEPKTVQNRISELRKIHGEGVVPYHRGAPE